MSQHKPDEEISVTAGDGATFTMAVYKGKPGAPAVLMFPAMGTKAKYYHPWCAALRGRGWNAAVVDLRGHGTHSVRASKKVDYGYADILALDWPAAIAAARAAFPGSPLSLAGHSLGGQLSALYLATHPGAAEGLILIASCTVYYRGWEGSEAYKLFMQTQLVGVIARTLGTFPGEKIGFAGREARKQMIDWSYNARTGNYRLVGSDVDYDARLRDVTVPVLAIAVEGDTFAPGKAVDNLTGKMPQAKLTRLTEPSSPDIRKNPHFLWAKHPAWSTDRVVEWGALLRLS